jgi:hypothetical protein
MSFLKTLRQKWDDWCGDHEMENNIRRHLTQHGYFGSSAKFQAVRLVAVQRPGWLQVYRFEVTARVDPKTPDDELEPEPEYQKLFGLVREDHRHHESKVRVFDGESERIELFRQWSEGLICLRGAKGLVSS